MEDLRPLITKNEIDYYLYITHSPVFDKKNGQYQHHEYVISYVSGSGLLLRVRANTLEEATKLVKQELQ